MHNTNSFEDRAKEMCRRLGALYEQVIAYHLKEDREIMLTDDEEPRRCRFCGRTEPEVTFNKVAHALSHMVENRHLKSEYECDVCNGKFAVYESDYSAYMNLYHTIFRVHGKGGIPKFKNNSKTFSKIEPEEKNIHIKLKEDEESLIEWEESNKEKNEIIVKGRRTYTPENVYRALIKMALTVMPKEEMDRFKSTINWLLKNPGTEVAGMSFPVSIRMYRGRLPFTSTLIFKRRKECQEPVPQYMFVLAYSNIVIQTGIPFVEADNYLRDQKGEVPIVPCPFDFESTWIVQETKLMMQGEKVRGEEVKITLHYDGVVERDLTNSVNKSEE